MNKAAAVALFVVAALLGASCAAPRMKLPSLTAGSPAVDATAELTEASRVCRQVSTMTAEIGVKGSISHQRIRVRLLAGLQAPSSAYLEAVAPFGAALFTLTMAANDATVVLPRENRVLRHGAPSAVLEALTGVPLDAADLKTTLTGCTSAPATGARSVDAKWIVLPDTSGSGGTRQDVYLTRPAKGGPWQIAAVAHHDAVHGDWHAEYSDVLDGLPRTIRLIAADDRFDLTLSLTQLETNVTLRDDTFIPRIPASASPITIEELRDASGIADSSTRDD